MVARRADWNNGVPVLSQALKELQWLSLFCAFSHTMIKATLEFSSWQLPPFQPHGSPMSGGGEVGGWGGERGSQKVKRSERLKAARRFCADLVSFSRNFCT